jgi:UDP-2,3-diacylglucosamine pyrophosphatase LpxH
VLGDVHLHPGADPAIAEDLRRLIEHLSPRTDALVFNGDLFDLDRVRGEPHSGVGAQRAAARVSAVLDVFPSFTRSLQRFSRHGGIVAFVAGNHDAEILTKPVRDVLIRRVARDTGWVDVVDRLVLDDVHVEHGHQEDPDAAFCPSPEEALHKERLSAFPLASLITRLLLSRIPRFELRGDNHRVPLRVLVRVLALYRLGALAMIVRFPVAGLRIVWQSVLAWRRSDAVSGFSSMGSPLHVARRLYLDRYFATVFLLCLGVVAAFRSLPTVGWAALFALALFLAVPPKRINVFAHRDAHQCKRAARRIADEGRRLVVFGHTHVPTVESIDANATYANHGAFSIPEALSTPRAPRTGSVLPGASGPVRPYLAITAPPRKCALRGQPCSQPSTNP